MELWKTKAKKTLTLTLTLPMRPMREELFGMAPPPRKPDTTMPSWHSLLPALPSILHAKRQGVQVGHLVFTFYLSVDFFSVDLLYYRDEFYKTTFNGLNCVFGAHFFLHKT